MIDLSISAALKVTSKDHWLKEVGLMKAIVESSVISITGGRDIIIPTSLSLVVHEAEGIHLVLCLPTDSAFMIS